MTTTDPSPEREGLRYLADRFQWAAPGDQQEDAWIVRFPTTTNRTRAESVAKASTRPTFDGQLVARVVEVSAGVFAVFVDKNGKPFGAASV